MKRILFIIPLLAAGFFVHAQTASTLSNTTATSGATKAGWFEVLVPGSATNHYTVSYGLSSMPFKKEVKMTLEVTNPISSPLSMSGKIINGSGTSLVTWNGNVGRSYTHAFDISSLPVGVYHLDIYDNSNTKVCSILFDKPSN